jgi:DNA-binding transcriptional MerR regulator
MTTSSAGLPNRAFMSIGEVLGQLRPEFADITISKIRFLEAEGLVEPERTASGYRKFSREDLSRLRYVLSAQRDHYLPLRVIKEHLEAIDRGLEPPAAGAGGGPKVPRALVAAEGLPGADAFLPDVSEIRLSRGELLSAAGLTPEQLDQLEQYGLLAPRQGGNHYDGDALVVAKTVAEMSRFGIEARHLRPFKSAAEREIGLVEQVVTPLVRQRNPEARARADEVARELAALSVKLHATLVRAGLGPGLRR